MVYINFSLFCQRKVTKETQPKALSRPLETRHRKFADILPICAALIGAYTLEWTPSRLVKHVHGLMCRTINAKLLLISCKLNYSFVSNQKFRTSTQTAHRNAVGTPTYRCTEICLQRIKPPQSNRPLHRYPVPGFQRAVFQYAFTHLLFFIASARPGGILKFSLSINLSVHCKLFALI